MGVDRIQFYSPGRTKNGYCGPLQIKFENNKKICHSKLDNSNYA